MALDTTALKAQVLANLPTSVPPPASDGKIVAATLRATINAIIDYFADAINIDQSDEALEDKIAALFARSTKNGITVTYDDPGNKFDITVPVTIDSEMVQDIVGAMIAGGGAVTANYNDAAGILTISAASPSINVLTASATTGTATIALGSTSHNACDITTTGSLTANVTGTGRQRLTLKVALGSAGHTLALQYNGSAAAVKLPGDIAQSEAFSTAAGSVYIFDCIGDGTTLEVIDFVSRAAGVPSRRIATVASMATAYNLDLSQATDTLIFGTLTSNITAGNFTVTGAAKGKTFYMEITIGGAGNFSIVFPTSSPNMLFPSTTIPWNTASGKINTFSGVCSSATQILCNVTKYL